jgi:hypothetical protein
MLDAWAARWGIPAAAIADLRASITQQPPGKARTSEAAAQQAIRLDATRQGNRLWRNNLGACVDERGNMVRYGLANDSKQLNDRIKSSDLIGITGAGVFTSIEVKPPGWKYRGTKRERAQLAWLELVIAMGGIGRFMTGPDAAGEE